MPLTTASHRRAAAHIARHYSGAGVTMDATPDQAWRQMVGRGYPGILSGTGGTEAAMGRMMLMGIGSVAWILVGVPELLINLASPR